MFPYLSRTIGGQRLNLTVSLTVRVKAFWPENPFTVSQIFGVTVNISDISI